MDNHDSQNENDMNGEDLKSETGFEPVNFQKQGQVSRTLKAFCDSSCDSWALDDLYCENQFETEEDQMIVLEDKHAVLSWAAHKLSASPSARAMLIEAKKYGWSLALEALNGPDFHLDVPEKLIVLDDQGLVTEALGRSEYFKNAVLVSLIRALRDVWQEKRHGAFDAEYDPEAVLMLERTRAADLDTLAVLVAWELRGEGEGSLWRHLIGSEDGDIAMRFSGYLERDPASLFNGKALAAAFSQWFRDERRVNNCDHEVLNYLDEIVQDYEAGEAFGRKKITPISIEMISCLPDRTAYLQGQGPEIIGNPLYAGLCDSINQAHFMQILYDLKVVRVQSVPFRNARLAEMIFPNGEFTSEDAGTIH